MSDNPNRSSRLLRSPLPTPQATTASGPRAGRRSWFRPGRLFALAVVVALVAIGVRARDELDRIPT